MGATNVEGFRVVLEPMAERLFADRPTGRAAAPSAARWPGLQMGSVLAWLSRKVLGQYEVFLPPEQGSGAG